MLFCVCGIVGVASQRRSGSCLAYEPARSPCEAAAVPAQTTATAAAFSPTLGLPRAALAAPVRSARSRRPAPEQRAQRLGHLG